jgi:predicted dithiol-disulfide oxidoreductase (DUF899 family)
MNPRTLGEADPLAAYQLLDRAPKGRDEDNILPGEWWWRRHDEYEDVRGGDRG